VAGAVATRKTTKAAAPSSASINPFFMTLRARE
jgi:hypothetical protein